ncbi:transient receptor potential cation channel subfamily V member 1 isoform X1 [Danio rerio]|uniref:Transient receptor potential cation channel subfamily V member 1 isoform X1 n=3 Tax=Danio rerio TaxID=7955 RepID=A0AC58JJJ2_DANRE|nr:transient receptor potential V1 channel [Danio rerio]
MSKSMDSSVSSFSLETDDQTEEERTKAKQMKKVSKDKRPMDSNYVDDVVEPSSTIKFNLHFDRGIRNLKEEPAQQDNDRFTIKRLFEAVSSGDVSKMQGLHEYLHKNMKRLTDSQYKSNGKTALLKALLNLRQGENDTIEQLLDIAEKMGDLKNFINAAYTDSYYKGQTALHVAIERRSMKFVQMLVKKGADVHAKACGKFFQPNQKMCFYFGELPLSLAACTNQQDIVDFLMENPHQAVDVRERDCHGNTVLHALVSVADNSPENTEFVIAMYDHILIKADQLHPKTKLEEIENNEGLTPITLAAKKGKLGLFKHIVQRELMGCRHLSRKITEWAYGPVCSSLYDLSSLDTYEKNSALEIVVYGSEIPNRLEMLQIEPLNRLIEEKWDRFAHRMFLFNFIVYVIYLFIFTASAFYHEEGKDYANQTKPPYLYAKSREGYLLLTGHIISITGAFYFFIRGLIDMVRKRPRFQSLIIDGYTDQLFFVQGLLFLASVVLYCYGQYEYLAFLVLCLALSWINLLYFSRGSKNLGIYNVMIQKMVLGEIRRFLVVYMVFLIGFSAALVTLLDQESIDSGSTRDFRLSEDIPSLNPTPDSSNPQSRMTHHQPTTARDGRGRFGLTTDNQYEVCKKPSYKNIYFTTLELFKFTIGMGDLEFTDHYKYKEVFYVLLIVYIVMTYILMLNMLIALMNQSVEMMSVESTSIWKLQRAITTLDMEWILPKCLQGKLRSGEEKDLGGGQEPDRRWCFSVEEVNWTQWNRNMGIIINEDPGKCTQDPSPANVQREPSRGVLQTFSRRRRTQRAQTREGHELSPLAEASSSV